MNHDSRVRGPRLDLTLVHLASSVVPKLLSWRHNQPITTLAQLYLATSRTIPQRSSQRPANRFPLLRERQRQKIKYAVPKVLLKPILEARLRLIARETARKSAPQERQILSAAGRTIHFNLSSFANPCIEADPKAAPRGQVCTTEGSVQDLMGGVLLLVKA